MLEEMCRFIGVFVILILFISDSRQQNEKSEEDKKIEAIFGPIPEDGQPLTESPLFPGFLNKTDSLPVSTSVSTGNNVNI